MSTVPREIRSLSVGHRLQLLEEIWDSLAETPEAIPVTDAQRKELARRRRAHARNPAAAKSWAEVRARLKRRKRTTHRMAAGIAFSAAGWREAARSR